MKIPKHLVEIEIEAWGHMPAVPVRPLWVARTRDPYCLCRIEVSEEWIRAHLWPAILETPNKMKLIDGLARALFREHDLYPGDWTQPEIQPLEAGIEPPEFLDMIRPESNFELILEPHAPRLWKKIIHDDIADGVEWVRGWGLAPEFPRDTRRIADFLRQTEL